MAWGIAESASEIEKIRAESSDYLGGLDSVGEIDYSLYCKLWDFYYDLLGKAYEQGLKDAPNDKRKEAKPVKYGRWQVNEVNGYKDMTCLSCGWLFEYYNGLEEEWNYCPHCGAKMYNDND